MARELTKAVAYLRTSSAANVGTDKDSEKRQLAAISSFARSNGFEVVDTYYDAAISGADPVTERPGFAAMLERLVSNGVKTILIESPDRFARDLAVQLTGHDMLRGLGIALIPTSAPDFFTADTPTAVLVRQILGAIAQFDKATLVLKLAGARKRKRAEKGKCEGRKSHAERNPEAVQLARELRHAGTGRKPKSGTPSLRAIATEMASRGFTNAKGQPFNPKSIASMLK